MISSAGRRAGGEEQRGQHRVFSSAIEAIAATPKRSRSCATFEPLQYQFSRGAGGDHCDVRGARLQRAVRLRQVLTNQPRQLLVAAAVAPLALPAHVLQIARACQRMGHAAAWLRCLLLLEDGRLASEHCPSACASARLPTAPPIDLPVCYIALRSAPRRAAVLEPQLARVLRARRDRAHDASTGALARTQPR